MSLPTIFDTCRPRADVLAESLARPQERRPEKVRVEELRIRLAGARTMSRLVRILFERDRVRDLERKPKARRH